VQIAVIGSGYVGLVTGACLADSGNHVVAVDNDAAKVQQLASGQCPFYEPGLEELVQKNMASGRLRFTSDLASAVAGVRVVFLAVGTPPRQDGAADLTAIKRAAVDVSRALTGPAIVEERESTIVIGEDARARVDEYGFVWIDIK
jgi:UDPglucose 6-dehydrogenase